MILELQVLLAGLLIYGGIPLGMLLVRIAPEEQKPYRAILQNTRRAVLILFFAIALAFGYTLGLPGVAFTILALILAIIWSRLGKDSIVYASLAIPLAVQFFHTQRFLTLALLAIIYGILAGVLETEKKNKNYLPVLLRHAAFYPLFIALVFLI